MVSMGVVLILIDLEKVPCGAVSERYVAIVAAV